MGHYDANYEEEDQKKREAQQARVNEEEQHIRCKLAEMGIERLLADLIVRNGLKL